MQDTRITLASLRSILRSPAENLARVEQACRQAHDEGARLILLPELMLTGHGAHATMTKNAEPVPGGPLSGAIVRMSAEFNLCICVGIAELSHGIVFNSQMAADRGTYLGLQRKINLSHDEYCHFGTGESLPVFDIDELRFGISICYDNLFPEIALAHSLHHVDTILAPHAARMGHWPENPSTEFCSNVIRQQQDAWERVHRTRAYDHNVYVMLCNAVGSSTDGLDDVVANHAGTVMAIGPAGNVMVRTTKEDFSDEIVTVDLEAARRKTNHAPTRNRRLSSVLEMLQEPSATPNV